MALDRAEKDAYHRVVARCAPVNSVNSLAPPLEPDLTEQGLGHHLGSLGDLSIERKQCQQVAAPPFGREQRGQIAVSVVHADLLRAIIRVGA